MSEQTTIGRYRITAELGRGGMGVVYKAWEESLQRYVAIKMLGDALAHDDALVERFLREARAVADLSHPNVVQVFTVDTHEGRPYFAMEYVEGESLKDLIHTSRRIDPRRAARIVREAASGLDAAHAKGVIHRDVKPDNIMLTKYGGVKVVDFGIARTADAESRLTGTGMMVGTPNYLCPEVCLGQEVDGRSDLFSLGVVFYEMLAGTSPFQADSPMAMMTAVVREAVPDIRQLAPEVDDDLRAIVAHLLAKDRQARYGSGAELVEDLDAWLAGEPLLHARPASDAPTEARARPELETTTEARPLPGAEAPAARRRPPGAAWLLGLLLVVGVAGGSWFYVAQPPPDQGAGTGETTPPPAAATASTSAGSGDAGAPQTESAQIAEAARPAVRKPPAGAPSDPGTPTASSDTSGAPAGNADADAGPPGDPSPAETIEPAAVAASPAPRPVPESEPPAPSIAAERGPPRLVVVARGDPSVASIVESVLEGALAEADFPVLDERFFASGVGGGLARLGDAALRNGADVLVYADVRGTGTRELRFHGRTEQQRTANLEVRALLLAEKRTLGTPWSRPLAYVPLNATDNAREVAGPIARDLVARLGALAD